MLLIHYFGLAIFFASMGCNGAPPIGRTLVDSCHPPLVRLQFIHLNWLIRMEIFQSFKIKFSITLEELRQSEWRSPSLQLSAWTNTAPIASRRCRAVDETASDLTGLGIEPATSLTGSDVFGCCANDRFSFNKLVSNNDSQKSTNFARFLSTTFFDVSAIISRRTMNVEGDVEVNIFNSLLSNILVALRPTVMS